jgi:hypothetical protein
MKTTDKEIHKKIIQPFFKIVAKKILPKLNPKGRLFFQLKSLIIQYQKETKMLEKEEKY